MVASGRKTASKQGFSGNLQFIGEFAHKETETNLTK